MYSENVEKNQKNIQDNIQKNVQKTQKREKWSENVMKILKREKLCQKSSKIDKITCWSLVSDLLKTEIDLKLTDPDWLSKMARKRQDWSQIFQKIIQIHHPIRISGCCETLSNTFCYTRTHIYTTHTDFWCRWAELNSIWPQIESRFSSGM